MSNARRLIVLENHAPVRAGSNMRLRFSSSGSAGRTRLFLANAPLLRHRSPSQIDSLILTVALARWTTVFRNSSPQGAESQREDSAPAAFWFIKSLIHWQRQDGALKRRRFSNNWKLQRVCVSGGACRCDFCSDASDENYP